MSKYIVSTTLHYCVAYKEKTADHEEAFNTVRVCIHQLESTFLEAKCPSPPAKLGEIASVKCFKKEITFLVPKYLPSF